MKRTISFCASVTTATAAFILCCLFNGCARGHLKEAVSQPIPPEHSTSGAEVTNVGTNLPLQYQWYSTTSSQPSTQFGVTASGNGPLHYVWHDNTNGGQPPTVQSGSTNGPLYYQWYKNTNP